MKANFQIIYDVRVTLSVPFPSRTHRERRSSYKSSLDRDETGKSRGLPRCDKFNVECSSKFMLGLSKKLLTVSLIRSRFPKRPEALVAADHLEQRRDVLEKYLQDLLKIRAFRNHHETVSISFEGSYQYLFFWFNAI